MMEEDNDKNLVLLSEFNSELEAHIVKNRLESNGVVVFLFNENQNTVGSFLGSLIAPVRLMVMNGDLEEAKKILSTPEDDSDYQNN